MHNFVTTFFLAFFLGVFGVHRFYTGKIATGVLMLLTAGGFGIWWLIDMLNLVLENFRDKKGNLIVFEPVFITEISAKNFKTTALLSFFLGLIGAHRFYTGKIGTGLLMLLTFGGCGIWWVFDLFSIIFQKFTDKKDLIIAPVNKINKRFVYTALSWILFHSFAGHRFYVGRITSAIFMILALFIPVINVISIIWRFVDFFEILSGTFTDKEKHAIGY